MSETVHIAVDAMGGDNAPSVVLEGVHQALLDDENLHVLLCGPAEVIEGFAADHDRCEAVICSEIIAMDESPALAVRRKKDSSIVVGCRLIKEGRAEGFFSAGSTGACLAAATLVTGRIPGVLRPAVGQILPAYKKPTLLLDVGANADCRPDYLVQFAQMGLVYMKQIMGIDSPTVALLNIGEEESKGSVLAVDAHKLLKEEVPEFVGNVEGRDLLSGDVDVIVTDGFTGNVVLKAIEGNAKTFFRLIKDVFVSSLKTKLGAALVKGDLAGLKAMLSPDTYGGAPLLGVKGAVLIGHGSSNALAVRNGIKTTASTARAQVSQRIAETIHLEEFEDAAE